GGALREGVFGETEGWNETVGGGKEKLAVGELVIEQTLGDGTDVAGAGTDCRINGYGGGGEIAGKGWAIRRGDAVYKRRQGCGAAVVCEPRRNGDSGAANLSVGLLNVLIGEKAEELVLEDRATHSTAGGVIMQAGDFVAVRNIGVGIVEKRSGIESVGGAIDVSAAVETVGAGRCAHVNVGAAGGTLLGVVHGGIDAKFFDGFGRGSGKRLADGEIGRSCALKRFGSRAGNAGGAADTGVVDDASGSDLAGAFAVEEIAGVDAVEKESVAGVALAVGPDGE